MIAAEQKKMEEKAGANQAASETFLKENGAREGVTTTDSGLQYEVLASGEEGAASPTLEDTVEVHYHGTLPDGTVFDSSVDRGQPATFGLQHIIKGWQEALPMMKEAATSGRSLCRRRWVTVSKVPVETLVRTRC